MSMADNKIILEQLLKITAKAVLKDTRP